MLPLVLYLQATLEAPPVSEAEADAAAAAPRPEPLELAPEQLQLLQGMGAPLVKITAHYHVNFGDCLKVVGSSEALGAWDAASAPLMTWGEGDVWTLLRPLPPGEHEFKVRRCTANTMFGAWSLQC